MRESSIFNNPYKTFKVFKKYFQKFKPYQQSINNKASYFLWIFCNQIDVSEAIELYHYCGFKPFQGWPLTRLNNY
jgi:hypothetical protein